MYSGVYVALITPFKDDLSVDYDTLGKLVDFHKTSKTKGIVVCGTTAETATLTEEEYKQIIEFVIKRANKELEIIVGVGSNNTKKVIENIKYVENFDVNGVLVVSPYYNKPNQRGLYEHFKTVANSTKLDIIIYDIPGRTGVKIDNDVIKELSKIENIKAIKDATGNIHNIYYHTTNTNLDVLSGDDTIYYEQLSIGCHGTISVTANVYPSLMQDMTDLYFTEEVKKSYEIFKQLQPVSENLFIDGNPVTVKALMYLKGMIPNMKVRLPLVSASDSTIKILKKVMI